MRALASDVADVQPTEVQPSETELADVVNRFYAKVRADALIGQVFNAAIHDWPEHLEKLARFWASIMLTTGAYKGNPMAAHTKHAAVIRPEMFDRWLDLWAETTAEVFEAPVALKLQTKAQHIARSLKMALEYHAAMSAKRTEGPAH